MVSPKRWNAVVGLITESLKFICKSSEFLAKLIIANWVFRSSELTKLSAPQLAILPRSALSEEIVSTLDMSLELVEGLSGNFLIEYIVE